MTSSHSKLVRLFSMLIFLLARVHYVSAQNTCDSLHAVGFIHQDNGAYGYTFFPTAPASGTSVLYTEWGFAGNGFQDFSLAPQPQYTFPGTGDYLVCLRATVQDDQQGTCLSTTCEIVPVPVDSACSGLVAAFTIAAQGGAIQFIDQSVSDGPITGIVWDFGDGSSSTEPGPSHTYPGEGPYEACLTTITSACSATSCNWIYLGPPDVPCDTLLHAAIGVIQYERTIAVFDQSTTSGMNSSIFWDFGDGTTATGSPILHTFLDDGYFQVCGSVDLWGPLTPDTCMSTACSSIATFNATGLGAAGIRAALRAFPVPFVDAFTVDGAHAGVHWELLDMLGRTRLAGTAGSAGPILVQCGQLDAGTYFFRQFTKMGAEVLRVIKCAGRKE